MNLLSCTDTVAHAGTANSTFYNSIVACIRSLTNDTGFSVSIGSQEATGHCDINLPLIADEENKAFRTLIRGLGDSFAMMRIHHQAGLHRSLAPEDAAADRLFTLMERERFEELGARQYPGVAYNLQQVWAFAHGEDALSRFGGAEQLEFVLSCLCREVLSSQPLPAVAQRFLEPIRGPVEHLVAGKVRELAHLIDRQDHYAACALDILKALGFDTTARIGHPTDNPENRQNVEDNDRDSEESIETEQSEEGVDKAEDSPKPDPEAELSDQAELVRNSEREPEIESEEMDLETGDTENIYATHLRDSAGKRLAPRERYSVFDKTNDEMCSASTLTDVVKLRRLRRELDAHIKLYEPLTGQLVNRLQQVLVSKQRSYWQQDLDEGELDPQRLTRIIVNPQAKLTYRVAEEADVGKCAVTILIDNSRSMFGKPIITAAVCADVITRVLERCGASTEVLGYTTVSMYGGELAQRWRSLGCPENVGRLNNIRHIVYKAAESSWQRSRDNFGLMLDKEILKQNIDGEALLWAHNRMQNRPETRRILMVISDGRPSDSYTLKANRNNFLVEHLEQVVTQIERQAAVELVAIGIGHEVSHHYRRAIQINDISLLGPVMMTELTQLLSR